MSSYQAVSGTGQKAVDELNEQARAVVGGSELPAAVRLSAPDRLQRAAAGRDASRTATTTRPRSASACARRARSSAPTTSPCRRPACACRSSPATPCRRTCRRATPLSPEECRELLAAAPGVTVIDDPANGLYPPRSTPPATTTSSSAASVATPRTSAASTSGSSATTCARARRPTRSRWPSCCMCAGCCGRRRPPGALAVLAPRNLAQPHVDEAPRLSQRTRAVPARASTASTFPISPVARLRTCPGGSSVEVLETGRLGRAGRGGPAEAGLLVARRWPGGRGRLLLGARLPEHLLERHHVRPGALRLRVEYPSLAHALLRL